MATQEKLQKSLEALKNLSQSNQTPDVLKKKEKVLHCHIITESISNASIKVSPNFQHLLGLTIEALLKLCDDQESDVRMTSEECLNRIIRATSTGNLIQIELHKEIKRNGAARSLRAAIWRFSLIAHLIRPLKGKAYVDNLFPSLQKVAKRSEEQIHETLAISVPKIMASLGSFSSDNEIQSLLGAFLNNITHTQAVIRRSAATCVLNICLYCRKPFKFVNYTLNYILDLLTPLNDNTVNSSILGVMNCVKVILPYLSSKSNIEMDVNNKKNCNVSVEKLLEVYEICLYYLSNKDHNVVNAALEALNVLLLNCTEEFMENLLSKNGIAKNKMLSSHSSLMKLKSPSQLSVATNVTSTEENRESELTETLHLDIEKWIDESKLSVMNENYAKPKENFDKSMSLDTNSSILTNLTDDVDFSDIKISDNYASKSQSFGDNLDNLTISENSSEKNSCVDENDAEDLNINIGDFWDKDPNIIYCARLIVKSFLLTGVPTCLVSDKVTRVSVKSLALTCLSSIVKLYPSILLIYLDKNVKSVNQEISDIFLFGDHPDPQLRGVVRTIISNFVKTVIVESNGNYMEWINANIIVENKSIFYMEKMVQMLTKGLEDESANCSRQTIISLSTVLPQILESKDAKTVLPILRVIPTLAKNPYWLVKVALCELVSKLPYITIHYVQCNPTFQNKIIHNVLFEMLADNDQRVRKSAANAIIDIIPYLYNEHFQTNENIITRKAMQYKNHYLANLNDVEDVLNLNKKHFIKAMPFPFDKILDKCPDSEEYTLSLIVNQLYKFLLSSTSKHLMMGCFESLCLLSNKYPSTVYKNAWILSNRTDEDLRTSSDLLDLCISFLNTSVMVYDINCQINMLELASNLFAGQSVCIVRPIPDLENSNRLWDMFEHDYVTEKCELYFSHVIKLLNIFHHVINDLHPSVATSKTVLPSLPSASNLSPIKRRKSDLDKKMILLSEKDDKVEKSGRLNVIAAFAHLPHYLKIYEVLKSSYTNYKVTLSSDTCERFLEVMRKSLKSVSVLMEVGTLTEFGRVSQELLNYLMSTFLLDPTSTVTSVQQMLKCMFAELIPNIFQFLVQLSYGKQHSKSIIGIPKIIQLCNGLLASGQPPLTHCVPALQPIVEDIFLTRNKSNTADMKDLETAREVVLSNLLKLIEYKEVVDLLVLILEDSRYCSDDPDKWQRWSEQIGNAAFAMLKSNRLRLDCPGSFSSLRKLIENLSEIDILNWILTKNIKFIIKLYNESPVTEFIYALNRNPFTSNLFIKSVEKECGQIDEPIFITTLLKCVSNAHSSQCGNVLHLLLTKFLTNKEVTISRNVAHIASRNIDLLLTMFPEEVNNQLPKEKLLEIRNTLITKELTKNLVSLLNKLSNQFHDLTPIELEQRLSVNPEEIKTLEVNKNWYLSQIRGRYGETQLSKETAELLKDLEYSEIYNFMSSKEFNKKCIKDCIRLAVRDIRGKKLEDDPDILKASVDSLLKDSHTRGIKKSLRSVSLEFAKKHTNLKPGQKLCPQCRTRMAETEALNNETISKEDIENERKPEAFFDSDGTEALNQSITNLGCTPVKLHGVNKKQRLSYAKRKSAEAISLLQEKFSTSLNVPLETLAQTNEKQCTSCEDLNCLIELLKEKCKISCGQEVLKLLTLVPSSWSIQKTANEFGVSTYMVNKARKLKKDYGILAEPEKLKGKSISNEVSKKVRQFYEDDEFSRMCPGKKEFVSVRDSETGKRTHMQKRLLFVNLKELHLAFQERYPQLKIGLSKFSSLRPPWCVTVSARGVHSVCVCETHQNLKLLTAALPKKIEYKNILSTIVCSVDSRNCMLHRCENCPGSEALEQLMLDIFSENDLETDDNIAYKQWVHKGQSTLVNMTSTIEDFVKDLSKAADQATTHHFTAKSQASYLRNLKENIPAETEVIVLLDFAENYSFVCQDAIQGFHWDTTQATLHPFVIYFRSKNQTDLKCFSMCVISDEREHITSTVHYFLKVIIQHIKEELPDLQYIHYFSDGSSAQYKNYKNFINLCLHKKDFNVPAEWNFFATSHGKSPCDGIGGTVKRLAARASLQATLDNHILTPLDLFNWANCNIHNIKFFFVSHADVQQHAKSLEARFQSAKTVPGTRSYHRFVPINNSELILYRLSSDDENSGFKVSLTVRKKHEKNIDIDELQPGVYVAAVYDDNWFIGCIKERHFDETDLLINFMQRHKDTNVLSWPSREDSCFVPFEHVLCVIPAPSVKGSTGRQYVLDSDMSKSITLLFNKFKSAAK
ncbi:unnamed protein product [Brassicogethes aeneus]|uniref:Huntingtin n=1 Tax=Brassicogethes aeneus TaxID=1431903 RepID=A0A9P0FIU2_BRAAE|nr:unnamed protein product [Brassicogethes aeneus]